MEFFACVILIAVMYIICKAPEWKASNRVSSPGMKTDWQAMSNDRIFKGMSNRDIYFKQNRGGYDIIDKRNRLER